MVRLEDRLVVVRERVLMLRLLQELVVHARVLIVVHCRRDDAREPVERRDQLVDKLVPDEVVGVEHHVKRVHRIVVRVLGLVAILDAAQEGEQPRFGQSELGDQPMVLEPLVHAEHKVRLRGLGGEIEDVHVPSVHLGDEISAGRNVQVRTRKPS